jgi:hypothetical protein
VSGAAPKIDPEPHVEDAKMLELVPAALGLVMTGGVIVAATWWQRQQLRRFREEAARFGDVVAPPSIWSAGLDTVPPLPPASIRAGGGGKNNPPRWDVRSAAPRLSLRTSLTIDREGILGALREKLGQHDVHIGDAAFDGAFCVRGSDPDVVRGVMQRSAVQLAVRALFDDPDAMQLVVRDGGDVHARLRRRSADAATVRQKLLAVVRLVQALEEHADAEPSLPPESPLRTAGTGGASGAPVGIPWAER